MPATSYGEALYGAALYGRVAAGLLTSQGRTVRETGLRCTVIDEQINRWEKIVDENLTHSRADFKSLNNVPWEQAYAYYRLQSAAIALPNGNIYRVRVGDGGFTDFQIYEQTITDPTILSQWTTWSVLYSGTHYAVELANNGNTPIVYAAKSGGLYRNNVLKFAINDLVFISPVRGTFRICPGVAQGPWNVGRPKVAVRRRKVQDAPMIAEKNMISVARRSHVPSFRALTRGSLESTAVASP
jgi:hypothetical protein